VKRLASAVVALTIGGCTCNLLPAPESRAASLPQAVDVPVGARHDVLIVACQDKLTLLDFVLPVASTLFFVGMGRLDAALYLPDALAESAIPKCKPTPYTVEKAAITGSAFSLETTGNPRAFTAHSTAEGEVTFSAEVVANGQRIPVASTLRAWKPDKLYFSPRCDDAPSAERLDGWIPAGKTFGIDFSLFHQDQRLNGYGVFGVSHPRLTIHQDGAFLSALVAEERGPFTVTSDIDSAFSLALTAYGPEAYDALTLTRQTTEPVFVGGTTLLVPEATIGGKVPCVDGYARTLTIEDPAVCVFHGLPGAKATVFGNKPLQLDARATGRCRISVTLEGTARTAAVEFPVFRAFEAIATPTALNHPAVHVTDLWATGPDSLVAVGWKDEVSGNLDHFTLRRVNGAWSGPQFNHPPRTLWSVHGSGSTALAVGNDGWGMQWDGTTWARFNTDAGVTLNDVWVRSPADAYAVGDQGTALHFDGATWSPFDAGTSATLRSVWGDDAGVLVVSASGTAQRLGDGPAADLFPADAGFLAGRITGSGSNDVWVLSSNSAMHFDGLRWSLVDFGLSSGMRLTGLWSPGGGFAYALVEGGSGTPSVARWDGRRAVVIPLPAEATAIGGYGDQVLVLGKTSLSRYRHDPADVFP